MNVEVELRRLQATLQDKFVDVGLPDVGVELKNVKIPTPVGETEETMIILSQGNEKSYWGFFPEKGDNGAPTLGFRRIYFG